MAAPMAPPLAAKVWPDAKHTEVPGTHATPSKGPVPEGSTTELQVTPPSVELTRAGERAPFTEAP